MKQGILYLHIGMPKSATSALQVFFAENRDILQKKGIVYPSIGNRNAHHRLGWSVNGLTRYWHDHDLHDCRTEWDLALEQHNNHKMILSSESLWALNELQIALVKEMTVQFYVKIVIYIRRQDTLIDSWYSELVEIGLRHESPGIKVHTIPVKVIDQWASIFGAENVLVRPYEKKQFHNGTIFSDFLHHVLGLELTDEFALPKEVVNPRLHHITIEYKRMVNVLPLSCQEKAALQLPLQKASTFLFQKGCKDYPAYSPWQRLQVYREYLEAHEFIARRYLKRENGQLFLDPPPDPVAEWCSYNDLRPEDAREVNSFLAMYYPEQLKIIVTSILEAQFAPEQENRQAAFKLLPGIPSACISQVVADVLRVPDYPRKVRQDQQLDEILASRTWKAGRVVRGLSQSLMPAGIRKLLSPAVQRRKTSAR